MALLALPFDDQVGQAVNVNHLMDNDDALTLRVNSQHDKYRVIHAVRGFLGPGFAAASHYLTAVGDTIPSAANTNASPTAFAFDPADITGAIVAPSLRLRVAALTNDVAPGITITCGLFPITASTGPGGSIAATLGTIVPSSFVSLTSPAVNSQFSVVSADFAAPVAGMYILGFTTSGAAPANTHMQLGITLQAKVV